MCWCSVTLCGEATVNGSLKCAASCLVLVSCPCPSPQTRLGLCTCWGTTAMLWSQGSLTSTMELFQSQ